MTSRTTATAQGPRAAQARPARRRFRRARLTALTGVVLALAPATGAAAASGSDVPVAVVATGTAGAPGSIRVAGLAAVAHGRVEVPLVADHPLTPPDVVGPDGRHARASLGALPGSSLDVVVVLDPARTPAAAAGLAGAASEAGDFLTALPAGTRAAAVVPAGSVVPAPRLSTDRAKVVSELTAAAPVTRSFVIAGVNAALVSLSQAAPGHRRMVVVATATAASPPAGLTASLNRLGASLTVVSTAAQPGLAPVAAATGGHLVTVPSVQAVAAALDGVRADLGSTVTAGFDVAGAGTYRLVWPGIPGADAVHPVVPTVSVPVNATAIAAAHATGEPSGQFGGWSLSDLAVVVGMSAVALTVMMLGTVVLGYGRRPRPSVRPSRP